VLREIKGTKLEAIECECERGRERKTDRGRGRERERERDGGKKEYLEEVE
jgi:hypothetical protein